MTQKKVEKHYVVCINNKAYRASLVVRRIYECVPDADAVKRSLIRVIDESGEDYLYPKKYFMSINLPKSVEKVLSAAT